MLKVLPGLHIYAEGLWFTLMQNLNPRYANEVVPAEC